MSMKNYYRYAAVVVLAALYLGTIWQRPLFIPDEVRYSEVPREMIASGNWLVPHLAGVHYFEKPVLGYWLNAGAMTLFGETPGAVRFAGALLTLLTAGLIWLLCRRAGRAALAAPAAVIFLFSGLVFAIGTYGVLDAQLNFFLFLMMTMFYFAWSEPVRWKQFGYLALTGVGCGLAFLTKGLLAVVLPAVAAVPFLLHQRQWKRIFTLPWIPLIAAALVALPVVAAVHRADPDFWRQFIWVEHFQRALSGAGANDDRSEPFWYFIPVILVGFLPWLLFLPEAVRGVVRSGRFREWAKTPLISFSLMMLVVWFLFFSASSGKLGTYILPCFPALAILFADGLTRYRDLGDFTWANGTLRWLSRLLLPLPLLVFLWQVLGRFTKLVPPQLVLYDVNENYFLPILALVLLVVWLRQAEREQDGNRKFLYFCFGIGFVMLAVHGSMPQRFTAALAPEEFIRQVAGPLAQPGTVLAADRALAASTAWALKRNDVHVYGRSGELEYGLSRLDGTPEDRRISLEQLREQVRQGTPDIVIVTQSEKRVREMPVTSNRRKYVGRGNKLFVVHYSSAVNSEVMQ